jgi:hypothetical protein
MLQSTNTSLDSTYLSKKLKHADERKFHLRKAIYEMDKLTYEKGTRSGDYLIREKIQSINDELKLYDDKLKICNFDIKADLSIIDEVLPFFEERYLDNFILNERITLLKQELINQNYADTQHNIDHPEENYKRNVNNPYRDELKKDIKVFETALINIISYLNELLNDINDLLFVNKLNKTIDEWSIKKIFEDSDKFLIKNINYFININLKIKKTVPTLEEIIALTDILLNETGIKSRLLRLTNIDERKLENILIHCGKESLSHKIITSSAIKSTIQEKNVSQKNTQQIIKNNFDSVLNNLRLLTEYKTISSKTGNTVTDNLSNSRGNKYLYNSPESGKLLLKDIADYLRDSLIFVNEWLLIELKKNPDLFTPVKFLVECLPAEIRFYDLFETANIVAAGENNKKINFWGDVISYISKETAMELIDIIDFICVELKDAFIRTIFDVELNKAPALKIFAKKINIIYDSFENAQKKIISAIRQLKKN